MYFKEFQGWWNPLAWFSCIQRADAIHISRELPNTSGQSSCWWCLLDVFAMSQAVCGCFEAPLWVCHFCFLVCWWSPAGFWLWSWTVPPNQHVYLSLWCFRPPESSGRIGKGLSDKSISCILMLSVFVWGWEGLRRGFKLPCTEFPRQNKYEHLSIEKCLCHTLHREK